MTAATAHTIPINKELEELAVIMEGLLEYV